VVDLIFLAMVSKVSKRYLLTQRPMLSVLRQRLSRRPDIYGTRGEANLSKEFVNKGFLHAVRCEWCGLQISCNCYDGNESRGNAHIIILCPRCQVTSFLNLLFGDKDLRSILESRIEQARSEKNQRTKRARRQLRLVKTDSNNYLKVVHRQDSERLDE
jgi:hypothetical protein